jgi:hypothetical protein
MNELPKGVCRNHRDELAVRVPAAGIHFLHISSLTITQFCRSAYCAHEMRAQRRFLGKYDSTEERT